MIVVPSAAQLEAASTAFDRDWGAVDDTLYAICRQYPDHSDRRGMTAKLALIGRAYSAGLERRVSPPKGQQAITIIADYVYEHRGVVDAIIGDVMAVQEPLAVGDMQQLVAQHGRLTGLLRGVTSDGKAPRSFAAKYLHFHNRAVPIYDSYAALGLGKLVQWDPKSVPFDRPSGADAEYHAFCVRFWRLYSACLTAGLEVTVKMLDNYLWTVPEQGPRRRREVGPSSDCSTRRCPSQI